MKKIIDFIKKEMKIQGLTNYALAKKTNLHESTIGRALDYKSKPHYNTIELIIKALGYTIIIVKN